MQKQQSIFTKVRFCIAGEHDAALNTTSEEELDSIDQSVSYANEEPIIQTLGGRVQGTEVHVLPPLDCDAYEVPNARVTLPKGTASAQARQSFLRAAEQRALDQKNRGIGDIKRAQDMQAASASANAAASTGTEVFGQRGQWRLRESLNRGRTTPASTDPQAATYSPVTSQTSSSLTPAYVTAHRCTSCDKPGHANNEDRRCIFYRRNRGQIAWAPNHPDSTLGNTVPHISETQIRISCNGVEQTEDHREPYWYRNQVIEIEVDGHAYRLGEASGDGCNCLIDTLRQKLQGIICNISWVRQELENHHRGKDTQIIPGDYLPLDFWDDIVDLLISHNAVTQVHREVVLIASGLFALT